MTIFQYKFPAGVGLQDLMDDISDAVNDTILVSPTDILTATESALSMAVDTSHGMGVLKDGTRFDVYMFRISSGLNDNPTPTTAETKVDVGLHLDFLMDDSIDTPASNSFKIDVRARARPPKLHGYPS